MSYKKRLQGRETVTILESLYNNNKIWQFFGVFEKLKSGYTFKHIFCDRRFRSIMSIRF